MLYTNIGNIRIRRGKTFCFSTMKFRVFIFWRIWPKIKRLEKLSKCSDRNLYCLIRRLAESLQISAKRVLAFLSVYFQPWSFVSFPSREKKITGSLSWLFAGKKDYYPVFPSNTSCILYIPYFLTGQKVTKIPCEI